MTTIEEWMEAASVIADKLSIAEKRIADLERQLSAREAQIHLLMELADQRNALIDELIARLPEDCQEIV